MIIVTIRISRIGQFEFIRELDPGEGVARARTGAYTGANQKPTESPNAELLARIDKNDLPEGYHFSTHQQYVDRRMAGLSEGQRVRIGQMWKEKQRIDPDMPNRGASFVKILEYVAENVR